MIHGVWTDVFRLDSQHMHDIVCTNSDRIIIFTIQPCYMLTEPDMKGMVITAIINKPTTSKLLGERIYIYCLVIIIKSEVWTITHCLGFGHETMVSAVCLSISVWPYDWHTGRNARDILGNPLLALHKISSDALLFCFQMCQHLIYFVIEISCFKSIREVGFELLTCTKKHQRLFLLRERKGHIIYTT